MVVSASETGTTDPAAILTLSNTGTYSGPGAIRTRDLLLRRQALYPAELRALVSAPLFHRGAGIRTRDLLLPKQARYQAALRPVFFSGP